MIQSKTKPTLVITKHDLIASISYCGIKQSPYIFPKNLELALQAVGKRIDDYNIFESDIKKQSKGYKKMEYIEVRDLIKDLIFNTPEIQIWNVTKVEQERGISRHDDKNRSVKFGVIGLGISPSPEDKDFIDLDALCQNVFGMLLS